MALLWLAIGFIAGSVTVGGVALHKFLRYQKERDQSEAHQRACLHQDFKEAVLEAALRGAGGPIIAGREEYFDM